MTNIFNLNNKNGENNANIFNNTDKNVGNELQTQQFYSDEFGSLDVLMIDGKPYFPATECAITLGYKNPRKAIIDHCKGVTKRYSLSNGGNQERNYIPEGDLYRLIIRSKLPSAVRFEAWVFDTVLPMLRKYGCYVNFRELEKVVCTPEFAINILTELQKEQQKNAELLPKANYCDQILKTTNSIPISIIAKDYGMPAAAFNSLLHDLRIQYKIGDTWLLYQEYAARGYTKTHTYKFGEEAAAVHTCWTQKGRLFLYELLGKYDIFPLEENFDVVAALSDLIDAADEYLHGGGENGKDSDNTESTDNDNINATV